MRDSTDSVPSPAIPIDTPLSPTSWTRKLLRSKPEGGSATGLGQILACMTNVKIALSQSPAWSGVLRYNESNCTVFFHSPPPWRDSRACPFSVNDGDVIRITEWMQTQGIMVHHKTQVLDAMLISSQERSYHPVREYLDSLQDKWDGTPRIDRWFTTHLGSEDTPFYRACGAKFLIGAVARIYQPGCKHDHCVVFEGSQGSYKSSALRALADPWFTDDIGKFGTRDAAQQLRGVWIVELAEMKRLLSKSDPDTVKSFISRQTDRVRLPYGRIVEEYPRENIFVGTVNLDAYLKDETGGRRFWPIVCGRIDPDLVARDRDQIWAEAVTRLSPPYLENWWLDTEELVHLAEREQSDRYEESPFEGVIAAYLANKPQTTVDDILNRVLGLEKADWGRHTMDVVRALKHQGWVRRQSTIKIPPAGSRRIWVYVRSYKNPLPEPPSSV